MLSFRQVRKILSIGKPMLLLVAMLTYTLGSGIAHYLGATIQWNIYWIGLFWILLILISMYLLDGFFEPFKQSFLTNQESDQNQQNATQAEQMTRWIILTFIAACLTVAASLSLTIIRLTNFEPTTAIILLLIFFTGFLYATPPFRLSTSGYGELASTLIISILIPALALLFQLGELHRLGAMVVFPLAGLQMAMFLAHGLQEYGADIRTGRKTLLTRIGWERGMVMHNLLILVTFALLSIGILLGLPFQVGGPSLFAIPLGALQIWMIRQISFGAKPNWGLLKFTSSALFGVVAYILTFMFWTR